MKLYLVRHGKDDATVRGGWSTSGLTDEGKIQVQHLVEHILTNKHELQIEKLYSSDLPRAIETVTPIATALNVDVTYIPNFRETNNGLLAGMPNDIANAKYPGLFWNALAWDECYPQGESPRLFYERIKTTWKQFSSSIVKENKNTMLVSHSGVMSVIFSLINNIPFSNKKESKRIDYATMIPLMYENGWKR